jgi:hypothetical protein
LGKIKNMENRERKQEGVRGEGGSSNRQNVADFEQHFLSQEKHFAHIHFFVRTKNFHLDLKERRTQSLVPISMI